MATVQTLIDEVREIIHDTVATFRWADSELIDYCNESLSSIKCPKSIDFDRKLPRSDAGKLFKRRIKQRYWEGRGSAII